MKKIGKSIGILFVFLMAIITLFPFIYMILGSLMTYQEATSVPPTLIPHALQFQNYAEALTKAPFVRYFINTVITAGLNTIGTLITTTLAAFALNFLNFRGKKLLTLLMIALLMVPFEVVVFTNYQTIARFGLLDSYLALIIPFLASIFYIFYLNSYLTSIPRSYYKAAKVDGCSNWEFIRKIQVPLSKSALFTIGLLSFISGWNSFLWPILVINTPEKRLISNGLSVFASQAGSDVHLQMAASTLTVVPILILYLLFRKQIIEGVSHSGLKG